MIRRLQLEDFHVSGERVIEVDLCGKATMVVQDVACPVVQELAVLLCRRPFIIAFVAPVGKADMTAPMELLYLLCARPIGRATSPSCHPKALAIAGPASGTTMSTTFLATFFVIALLVGGVSLFWHLTGTMVPEMIVSVDPTAHALPTSLK